MTPLQAEAHQRHRRFHQAIAERAALVAPKEELQTYVIPNKPFGERKIAPPVIIQRPDAGWNCMWFWDLVRVRPRVAPYGPSIEHIKNVVAAHFGITRQHITGLRRTKDCVLPRQIAMYLAKVMTRRSYPDIARRFGGRDHTTALHSVRKMEALVEQDQEFAAKVNALKCQVLA